MKKIKLSDITAEDLFLTCQQAKEPLLITDIYELMPELAGLTPEVLEKRLPGKRMVMVRSGETKYFDVKAQFVPMEFTDYLNRILRPSPSDHSEKLYMQQQSIEMQFPELEKDVAIERVLPPAALKRNKLVTYKKLWVGPAGNITPLHFDLYDNYFIQMHGTKTFYLYSPSDLPNLYPYGPFTIYPYVSRINPKSPDDIKNYPKIKNAVCHEVTVEPGTILYMPSYWWHQVAGDESSINISVNIWLSRGVIKFVPGYFNILPAFIKRFFIEKKMQASQAIKSFRQRKDSPTP